MRLSEAVSVCLKRLGAMLGGLLIALTVMETASFPVVSSAQAGTPISVTDARIGLHPDKTRFVIELSKTVKFRVFTLDNPKRVVIDLPQVDWKLPFNSGKRGMGPIRNVRYDLYRAGTSRLVLDLDQPLKLEQAFIIPAQSGDGRRLVMDFSPTTAVLFSEKAGWPTDNWDGSAPVGTAKKAVPIPVVKKRMIVIDPGHGGKDPGARGKSGVNESDVVLAMSKALKKELENSGRYRVALTREDDSSLKLRDRIKIARDKGAELFLSIHADAISGKSDVRGASVYTLSSKASDKEAAALAEKENQADLLLGVDMMSNSDEVNDILIDLAMRDTMNGSAQFARILLQEMQKSTRLVKNSHRSASLVVLKAPDVPSVLVEMGYLSNRGDEKNLKSAKWRTKLAKSMVKGIDRYFGASGVFVEASR